MRELKPLPKEINGIKVVKDYGTIFPTETSKERKRYATFLCRCGAEFKVRVSSVKNGDTTSCGCLKTKLFLRQLSNMGYIGTLYTIRGLT